MRHVNLWADESGAGTLWCCLSVFVLWHFNLVKDNIPSAATEPPRCPWAQLMYNVVTHACRGGEWSPVWSLSGAVGIFTFWGVLGGWCFLHHFKKCCIFNTFWRIIVLNQKTPREKDCHNKIGVIVKWKPPSEKPRVKQIIHPVWLCGGNFSTQVN